MSVSISCSKCGEVLILQEKFGGKVISCPQCKAPLRVPLPRAIAIEVTEEPEETEEPDVEEELSGPEQRRAAIPTGRPDLWTPGTCYCPHCGQKQNYRNQSVGTVTRCRACGESYLYPVRAAIGSTIASVGGCLVTASCCLWLGCLGAIMPNGGGGRAAVAVATRRARPAPTPEKQKQRKELIDELCGKGVFLGVRTEAGYPQVYIGPVFRSLRVQDRLIFLSVVYCWYYKAPNEPGDTAEFMNSEPSSNFVEMLDDRGIRLGSYGPPFPAGMADVANLR